MSEDSLISRAAFTMWRALRIGVLLWFADPQLVPRYPQRFAEIMAVKVPLSATEARMPDGLEDERVGPLTAREIGWVRR